jgi:SAM-dependent methyltransferase
MRRFRSLSILVLTLFHVGACTQHQPAATCCTERTEVRPKGYVRRLVRDANAVRTLVRSPWVHRFLDAAAGLPRVEERVIYHDTGYTRFYTAEEMRILPRAARTAFVPFAVGEEYYYSTRYGSPISYARPFDLAATAGFDGVAGKRILDFGYGYVGHLRMLASLGAQVVAVDVDPSLVAVYSEPEDTGPVKGVDGVWGSIRLLHGRFPADAETARAVGGGFDLIVSKNVLKRGYVHPAREAPPEWLIDLGVDDETFVATLFELLEPGGWVMVYNMSPRQNPPRKPYIPWADGETAFARHVWREVGFEIVAFDEDDTESARTMARALDWHRGPRGIDIDDDLFACYTLVRKPGPVH